MSAPVPGAPRAPDPLRAPRGPLAHLRYSFHALRRWRRLGQTLDLLDERLRVAVVRRDEALARLGQSALGDRHGGHQVRAFHETLTQLDADLAAAEAAREAIRAERLAAEGERQEALARFEMRLEATRLAKDALQAQQDRERKLLNRLEGQLARVERRLTELASRAAPKASASSPEPAAEGGAGPGAEAGPDPEAEAESLADGARREAQGELEAQAEDTRAQCGEATARLTQLGADCAAAEAELQSLADDRREALASADEALGALTVEEQRAQQRLDRLQARRRAVLMDLGHEVLAVFPDDAGPGQTEAREALAHIQRLRAEHAEIERERANIGLAPVLRTGILLAAAGVAVLLLLALAR